MYTPREVGEILEVTNVTVLKLIHNGKIKAVKIGGQYKITQEEVDRILQHGTS